ncbi:PD-(D/E)XK nuclease superfamily [Microdochium nivale]|nr:PD-(D/E)XK nuclease superfamily [Microdochium nivale]
MGTSTVDIWLATQLDFNAQARAYLQQHRDHHRQRQRGSHPPSKPSKPSKPPVIDINSPVAAQRVPRPSKMRTARVPSPSNHTPDSTPASTRPVPPTSSGPERRRPQVSGTRRSQRQRANAAAPSKSPRNSPAAQPQENSANSRGLQRARFHELSEAENAEVAIAAAAAATAAATATATADDAAVRSYAAQLHQNPSLSLGPPQRKASTRASSSTTTNRRARSRTKTISDMSLLDKPCAPMSWDDAVTADVLHVETELRRDLWSISQNCKPIIPRSVETNLRLLMGDDLPIPGGLFDDQLGHDASHESHDFDTIQHIVQQANRCAARRCCEAQWNVAVHGPVLDLALAPFTGRVEYDCITSAAPLDDLVPTIGDARVSARYIDFGIQLVPTSPAYQDAIRERLRQQLQDNAGSSTRSVESSGSSSNRPTINQSAYYPIHDRPLAISIETKTPDAGEGDALTQLAIWISCGHRKLHQLMGPSSETSRLPSLPILRVVGHTWTLAFAIDLGDRIALIDFPHDIGNTRTAFGTYRLLASMRRLVEWADGSYREWFGSAVLGLERQASNV